MEEEGRKKDKKIKRIVSIPQGSFHNLLFHHNP